jgi:capsid portal protein|tara:strand:- start:347 stop:517 length:171 start_codon:yes stop_codon:yes gene_type:complete
MKVGDLVVSIEEFWSAEVGLVVEIKPWHQDGFRVYVLMPDGNKYWFFHDQLKLVNK